MSVEIGSLVVRASFGSGGPESEPGVSDERLGEAVEALRREFRDKLREAVDDVERRLREG
jgi:hypothetical protein